MKQIAGMALKFVAVGVIRVIDGAVRGSAKRLTEGAAPKAQRQLARQREALKLEVLRTEAAANREKLEAMQAKRKGR